ncbi:MAG: hypothetical protein AVDCRST_MAG19-1556, partial [uncultured Thermomicrobiales bacterium]
WSVTQREGNSETAAERRRVAPRCQEVSSPDRSASISG